MSDLNEIAAAARATRHPQQHSPTPHRQHQFGPVATGFMMAMGAAPVLLFVAFLSSVLFAVYLEWVVTQRIEKAVKEYNEAAEVRYMQQRGVHIEKVPD